MTSAASNALQIKDALKRWNGFSAHEHIQKDVF